MQRAGQNISNSRGQRSNYDMLAHPGRECRRKKKKWRIQAVA
jgi:hypothetical protein